jgi:CMP-N-acetylneuraminic acid synthetase
MQPLAGKPLVAWSVEAARAAGCAGRVVVSTDDGEIAGVAREHGAGIVMRPPEISGDSSSSESALLHVLDTLREQEGYEPDVVVFLQCTSPLTTGADIDAAVQTLLDRDADTAVAVTPSHAFLWREGDGGEALALNHDKAVRPMRQDLPPEYRETGAIYVMRAGGFLEARHRFFGKTVLYVMPAARSIDIDEPLDLRIAEFLLREQGNTE